MQKLAINIVVLAGLTIGVIGATHAQNVRTVPGAGQGQNPTASGQVLVAPYDKKLMRLAEVLGSIHFLRELCKANEGLLWRKKMVAIIDAEQPRPLRRSRLIARFNRGYGAFNRTYRTCTPSALLAVDRYMKEGVLLTSQINTRYGR